MHQTIIFFLPENGQPKLVPQDEYAQLARGAASCSRHRHQRVRVADWYVSVRADHQWTLENETYGFLSFDGQGATEWPEGQAQPRLSAQGRDRAQAWAPSESERAAMRRLIDGHLRRAG